MSMTILKKKLEKLITISEKVNIIRNMRIINHITQETMANYLHYTRIEYNRKERQNERKGGQRDGGWEEEREGRRKKLENESS